MLMLTREAGVGGSYYFPLTTVLFLRLHSTLGTRVLFSLQRLAVAPYSRAFAALRAIEKEKYFLGLIKAIPVTKQSISKPQAGIDYRQT